MTSTPEIPGPLLDYPPRMQAFLARMRAARERYDSTDELRGVAEAVKCLDAIRTDPDFPHLHVALRSKVLDYTGETFIYRFALTGSFVDLERGLRLRRDALMLMREHHDSPEYADCLSNLALRFADLYRQTEDAGHLGEWAELVRQLPSSHKYAFAHTSNVGIAFAARHSRTGASVDVEEAIRWLRKALEIRPGDVPKAKALNYLAMAVWDRYHRSKRSDHLDAYEAVLSQFPPDGDDLAGHQNNLAKGLWEQYERTKDLSRFAQCEQIVLRLPQSCPDLPAHWNNVGTGQLTRYEATSDAADLHRAIQSFERAVAGSPRQKRSAPPRRSWLGALFGSPSQLNTRAVAPDSPQEKRCRALANLGTALMARYARAGASADLENAVQRLEDSVSDSSDGSDELGARLASLGDALRLRYLQTRLPGDLDLAIEKCKLAVEQARGSPDLPGILISRGIGFNDHYDLTGDVADLKAAIADFRAAVDATSRKAPDRPVYLNSLASGLSQLHARTGDMASLDEAIRAFREAVSIGRQSPARLPEYANYLNNLSNALALRYEKTHAPDSLDEAIQCSREAVRLSDPMSPMLPSFRANLGSRLLSHHRRSGKSADLNAVIETWEGAVRDVRTGFARASVSSKIGGQSQWPTLYANLASALLERMTSEPAKAQASLRRAIEVVEQSKSYLLAEQFSRADLPVPAGVPREEAESERRLLGELTQLDAAELAGYSRMATGHGGLDALRGLRRREQCHQELELIWAKLEKIGPQPAGYVALRRNDPARFDDFARLADEIGTEAAVLSLFTAQENTVMFVMRKGEEPQWIDGKITEVAWEATWSSLVRQVHRYPRGAPAGEKWDEPLRNLLEKTCAQLRPVKRVVLAPHGPGHLIPWSAAISDLGLRRPTEDPLPVITVPTLKLVVAPRSAARGRPRAALVVGNPTKDLEFAEAEARDVAAKLGTHAILEKQATKAAVLGRMESADVIHLATHAFLATGNPMDSGIRLADGVLTAREVMQRRLRADLLVLSACETGLGTSLGGDELGGLSRAFMYAGVRSMIVSLWKVDDMATAALMTAFYDAYCNGVDKAEALSQAMAHIRAREKWQHPFYWGAFVLMGEWN